MGGNNQGIFKTGFALFAAHLWNLRHAFYKARVELELMYLECPGSAMVSLCRIHGGLGDLIKRSRKVRCGDN